MMLQLIDRRKIYFYLALLLILLSIHNLNFINSTNEFFKIKKIILKGNIKESLNQEISISLDKFYNYNIFTINPEEIKNTLDNFSIISKYKVKKEYPSVIKIDLKKAKILAYYFENNQKIYIADNEKIIKKINFLSKDLPFIEGDIDIKKFFILKKSLRNNGFELNDFNKLYFFKSNRWDLLYKNKILVKLSIDDLDYSLSLLKDIIQSSNTNDIKIIDLRIKNRIVIS
tara:strand:- start:1598 stop:2284 length:687 start_codon:yes stop_codon:yes gene_type:complete